MKIKGLRWYVVGLVGLATVVNYIDRNALGILWPQISLDLGFTEEESKNVYATISVFFLTAYAISKGLSGRLFDIIGTRIGFVVSIVVWSGSAILHAFASGGMSMSIFRAMLGAGEAGNWPGATKANAEWFPVRERALAQGIFNSGASIGAIISAPLIAIIFTWIGWKGTFILIGLLGFIWVIPWLYFHRGNPDVSPLITDEEREYILKGSIAENGAADNDEKGLNWGQLLVYKETWAIIVCRFLLDPIWWLFVIWLPIYLNDSFGFNIKEIGAFAWAPYLGAAIGSIFGGWLARKFIVNGWTINKTRKVIISVSGVFMLFGLIAGAYASSPVVAMILIAIVLFGFQMAIGNIQTMPSDYFSGKSIGTLSGLGEAAAAAGTILLSTYLIPFLSKESYMPVFMLGALLVPVGIAAIFILGGTIQRKIIK
jgi:ACS family hexuronate transporter-like MFS transporter